jgi:peroxiredoxin
MQKFISLVVFLALGSPAIAVLPVPRRSAEFLIVEPSGKQTLLSSLKGRVVLLEFLMTNCPHCQRASRTIAKLHQDLGPRGFTPIGIAFEPSVTTRMVTGFVQQSGVAFPIGQSSPEAVDSYLGRSQMERLMVPQIVVIDRGGVIRAQSGPNGDPNLENENYMRNLLDSLLKEGAQALKSGTNSK